VKGAYLNAELEEEIYMKPPPGYLKKGQERKVCQLLKGLYGLKQARRRWYLLLYDTFRELGFACTNADHSVFYISDSHDPIIVAVSVDNMTIATSKPDTVAKFKDDMRRCFEISDLGEINWLLGVEVMRDRKNRNVSLSQ